MASVPIWVLRMATMRGGRRLPHVEHLERPQPQQTGFNYLPAHYSGNTTQTTPIHHEPWTDGDNLAHHQYRWWVGSQWKQSQSSTCRACHHTFYSERDREQHHKTTKCRSKLTHVYSTLLRDKNCVVCDKRTGRATWGVPLCSKTCQEYWKLNEPLSLIHELKVVNNA